MIWFSVVMDPLILAEYRREAGVISRVAELIFGLLAPRVRLHFVLDGVGDGDLAERLYHCAASRTSNIRLTLFEQDPLLRIALLPRLAGIKAAIDEGEFLSWRASGDADALVVAAPAYPDARSWRRYADQANRALRGDGKQFLLFDRLGDPFDGLVERLIGAPAHGSPSAAETALLSTGLRLIAYDVQNTVRLSDADGADRLIGWLSALKGYDEGLLRRREGLLATLLKNNQYRVPVRARVYAGGLNV